MDDIKEEFYRVAMEEIKKHEPYFSNQRAKNIVDIRWDNFVADFVQSGRVLDFALGKL